MRTDWKLAAGTIIAAGALAVPASASAAITAPLAPCYETTSVAGAPITLSLTGGTPGDSYDVTAAYAGGSDAGGAYPATPFDANGDATVSFDVEPKGDSIDPVPGSPVTLTVEDDPADGSTPTDTVLGTTLITVKGVNINFTNDNPKAKREVTVANTAFANQVLYGFVTNNKGTRVLNRIALGKANVCGYVAKKTAVTPGKIRQGDYRLYINPGKRLNKKLAMSYGFELSQF